jgi:hypothetical protein
LDKSIGLSYDSYLFHLQELLASLAVSAKGIVEEETVEGFPPEVSSKSVEIVSGSEYPFC